MKLFDLNCPRCGTYFYVEELLMTLELPLHCPGCDAYLESAECSASTAGGVSRDNLTRAGGYSKSDAQALLYVPTLQEGD